MAERGGPTTQSGIYYQNSVAALFLGRLCETAPRPDADLVKEVRVEAPVEVDDIVVTFADGHHTYIQAKESISSDQTAWVAVWKDFDTQYRSPSFTRTQDRLLFQIGEPHQEHSHLRQICDRVTGSGTYGEWWHRLSKDQQKIVEKIKPLLTPELQADAELLTFFGHVRVEVWPLAQIERDYPQHWMPQSSVLPATLFRLLRDRVGGEARVRGRFVAPELRQSLAIDGVRFLAPSTFDELRAAVQGCSAVLRQQKHTIGHTGRHVSLTIVRQIVDWVQEEAIGDQNIAVLLDQAGSGKTVVSRDVLHALEEQGVTVLAVKADQQLSNLTRYEDLPALLHLPETVERAVARLATLGPICVLIDQVDALSLSLARDQAALNVLLELVARLRLIPNVRLLLSCRTFDFHSDPRLRRTAIAKQFHLSELAAEDIRSIMAEAGVPFDALPPAAQKLLRVPLHLDLFMLAVAGQPPGSEPPHALTSLQDLYSLLWRNVILKPEAGAPSAAEREDVLRRLTEDMDKRQRTSAPQALLTRADSCHLEAAARWLASAGILVLAGTGNDWSFLHQTFFDYCYAKQFVESGASLTETVLQGEQGLFARPQLIQVLTYLRGSDPQTYLSQFSSLLTRQETRVHLRDLLQRWFGSLPDPSDAEWTLFNRMIIKPELRPRLLLAIEGNAGWFDRLTGGAIQNLLALDDPVLDGEVMPYLTSMIDVRQADVISLLRPFLGRSTAWDNRIAGAMLRIGRWQTTEAVALFEQFIRAVPTLSLHRLHELDDIAKYDPEAGCRLLRLVLDRLLDEFLRERAAASSYPRSLPQALENLNGSMAEEALRTVRERKPELFLQQMLPWLERVLRLSEKYGDDELFYDADELSHGWHDQVYVVSHELIESITAALSALAQQTPAAFQQFAARLAALPYQTSQQILARVYAEVAGTRAVDALAFLLGDQRRLNLGDHEQYESRQLIAALFPYLSDQQRADLEASVLAYEPIRGYPGTLGLHWRGLEQLYLLQAIPFPLLTQRGARRLRELQDKFPKVQASKTPIGMQGGTVGPPVSYEAAPKMSDTAWLRAMVKYSGHVEHKDILKGGAYQLGHVLQERVKEDPTRFRDLLQEAPDDLDDNYVQAFLNGLSGSGAPAEWLFEAVRRFAPQPQREVRRTVAWALEKRASGGLPDDLMDLVEGYVRDTALDPEQNGEPDFGYLNSDRGSAFRTYMRGLAGQATPESQEKRWALIEFVAGDPSTSLRAGAVEELLYVYHEDSARAVSLFEKLLDGHPALLSSHWLREFVYHGLSGFYGRMQAVIQAMLSYPSEPVQQNGAELACIAAISPPVRQRAGDEAAARALADLIITGPVAWRRGAVRIYTHNLVSGPADHCLRELVKLVDDEDEQVRRSISHRFRSLGEAQFFLVRPLMEAFAASPAQGSDRYQFSEYLWEHGILDPAWTLSILQTVLDNAHAPKSYPSYGDGEVLVRLVIRIYTDPTVEGAVRTEAMHTFDRLMERYQGDVERVLGEWDRR